MTVAEQKRRSQTLLGVGELWRALLSAVRGIEGFFVPAIRAVDEMPGLLCAP